MTKRNYLLLQGVATPFFSELGKELESAGHSVLKVNFCGGDLYSGSFFSTKLNHINFKGKLEELDSFYTSIFNEHNITDILLFGDTRPIHTPALKVSKDLNISIHVFEEGYFRPDFITLDKNGVNAYSSLSKDPEYYRKHGNLDYEMPKKGGGGLAIRAWYDIRYHAATLLLKNRFPHYKPHRPERALKEYWGWIRRLPSLFLFYNDTSKIKINKLLKTKNPFYVLPLQLDGDSQIRIHSPFKSVSELIETALESFANHAPKYSVLVIKNHPLDPWFVNYPKLIKKLATQFSIDDKRIIYLESGNLDRLLKHTKGTVLVNSTVGTSALSLGSPVIALGSAIYDFSSLTFQGSLDQFWTEATPPDEELFNCFKSSVINETQINGGFYSQKGIELAVQGSLSKLIDRLS